MTKSFTTFLLISFALYAALIASVALQAAAPSPWHPNLLLLATFVAMQSGGGIGWAAVAGLMCDGLSGRPLGVTMLAATLTATVARESLSPRLSRGPWTVGHVFAFVAVVESASRFISSTVAATPDQAQSLLGALQVAASTTLCAAVGLMAWRIALRLAGGGERGGPLSLAARAMR